MSDYSKMKKEEFDTILIDILSKKTTSEILLTQGAYEVFSEEFNNEVLEEWEKRQKVLEISRPVTRN